MTAPPRIYLDNAASTPPLPAVVDAMAEAQRQLFGNPSSAHSFGPPAKFVRRYADLSTQILQAVEQYASDVRSGDFPADSESYHLPSSRALAR